MTEITATELVRKKEALQKELQTLQREAAVAAADAERIKGELGKALEELKAEYGCSSYDEAEALRDSLLSDLAQKCDDLEERINAIRR